MGDFIEKGSYCSYGRVKRAETLFLLRKVATCTYEGFVRRVHKRVRKGSYMDSEFCPICECAVVWDDARRHRGQCACGSVVTWGKPIVKFLAFAFRHGGVEALDAVKTGYQRGKDSLRPENL